MNKISVVSICLCIFLVNLVNPITGQNSGIYGGPPIDISDAPYQVSIEVDGEHWCGGSIISKYWIVTAAHCVTDDHGIIVVHAGATDQTDNSVGQRIEVEEFIQHPMSTFPYVNSIHGYDIALLKLSDPLCYNEDVQPIPYADSNTNIPIGTNAFISGWGWYDPAMATSDVLRGTQIPLISTPEAIQRLSNPNNSNWNNQYIGPRTLAFYENGVAAGGGDSGGPAVVDIDGVKILVGASSFGGIPLYEYPTIYANVGYFSDWIFQHAGDSDDYDPECDLNTCDLLIDDFIAPYDEESSYGGNIIVSSNGTLTIQADLKMGVGKHIIVETGGTLLIENAVLDCCQEGELWGGIILEDGAIVLLDDATILNADIGIEMHNVDRGDFSMSTLNIEDCTSGISIIGADDFQLEANDGSSHTYTNCDFAISVQSSTGNIVGAIIQSANVFGISSIRSSGNISHCEFSDCETGIILFDNDQAVNIFRNNIGYNNTAIYVSRCDHLVDIEHNEIGGAHGQGATGINATYSNIYIHDQRTSGSQTGYISADALGIYSAYTLQSEGYATIISNDIDISGTTTPGHNRADGIRSFMDFGTVISDNSISGNGLTTGINCSASDGNNVIGNTVEAMDSGNGIAITGGFRNYVSFNDIQNSPSNGILNTASFNNIYEDNDITAQFQGLSIEPGSGNQQMIICNRFCDGNMDLNIESEIGLQEHFHNQFRENIAQARAPGLDATQIERSRFLHGIDTSSVPTCGYLVLSVGDDTDINNDNDINNLFEFNNGGSDQSCSDSSGSGINGDGEPEVDCDYIEYLKASGKWGEIQRLIAAGQYIADCDVVWPCDWAIIFGELEQEFRQVVGGSLTALQSVASDQLNLLSSHYGSSGYGTTNNNSGEEGNPIPTEPCDSLGLGETYYRTYETMLHQVIGEELSQTDLNYLYSVAELCTYRYGDVVEWARGILAIAGRYDIVEKDCTRPIIESRSIIAPISQSYEIVLSPNPADDRLQIDLMSLNTEDQLIINIQDMMGRNIMSKTTMGPSIWELDTSDFSVGLYRIILNINKGKVIENRILVISH